jgi:hypothetical protein
LAPSARIAQLARKPKRGEENGNKDNASLGHALTAQQLEREQIDEQERLVQDKRKQGCDEEQEWLVQHNQGKVQHNEGKAQKGIVERPDRQDR